VKRILVVALLTGASVFSAVETAQAARVVVRRGPRGHVTRVRVTTHAGFPLHRTMPNVIVRGPVVRVAPRVYLSPIAFGAVVVASLPPAPSRVWTEAETLDNDDGWTDFTMNVDKRGKSMVLEIDRGAAQVSFAEVVFENGDTQVVDFNDRVHASGVYRLIDFADGRKVDHVRLVAKADTNQSVIRLYLVS